MNSDLLWWFNGYNSMFATNGQTHYSISQTNKGYKLEIVHHSTKQVAVEPTKYNKSIFKLLNIAQKFSKEKIYDS